MQDLFTAFWIGYALAQPMQDLFTAFWIGKSATRPMPFGLRVIKTFCHKMSPTDSDSAKQRGNVSIDNPSEWMLGLCWTEHEENLCRLSAERIVLRTFARRYRLKQNETPLQGSINTASGSEE